MSTGKRADSTVAMLPFVYWLAKIQSCTFLQRHSGHFGFSIKSARALSVRSSAHTSRAATAWWRSKVFRLDVTPEQSAALVRELEQLIARDIRHRGVAAPIAAGLDGHAAYLASEYVVGNLLDVSARERRAPGRSPTWRD